MGPLSPKPASEPARPDPSANVGRRRVIIVGAAGRDFHNFNVVFRDESPIPGGRVHGDADSRYRRAALSSGAGRFPLYPDGIPIWPRRIEASLIVAHAIDQVVFSYSDVSYAHVMHRRPWRMRRRSDFVLLGGRQTMLRRHEAGHLGVRRADGLRVRAADRADGWRDLTTDGGSARRRRASPDAVWRSGGANGVRAIRDARRSELRITAPSRRSEEYEPHIVRAPSSTPAWTTPQILAQAEQRGRHYRLGWRQQ